MLRKLLDCWIEQKHRWQASIGEELINLRLTDETLGKRIAHYRKERNLSQAKLAAIVGMEHNHLSCIEAGLKYPRINMIARIAVALGVSIEDLGRNEIS